MKNIHRVNGFIYIYGDNDKVILSNDPELATFGVQELSEDVIQYLSDNPSCEWLEIRKEKYSERFENDKSAIGNYKTWGNRWLITLPEPELKKVLGIEFTIKQETVEEVAERIAENFKNIDFKAGVIYGIIEGVEWKQEQDKNKYSEEEVNVLLQKALIHKDDGEIGALVTAQGEIRTANFNQWVDKYVKRNKKL